MVTMFTGFLAGQGVCTS